MTVTAIYLHVGWGKTATKALQGHFFPAIRGVSYLGKNPRFVDPDIDRLMAAILSGDSLDFDLPGAQALFTRQIAPRLAAGETLLLSMESLTSAGSRKVADRGVIADRLRRVFGAARILVTIRNQPDLLRSLYVFHLAKVEYRETRWLNFDEWLAFHQTQSWTGMLAHLDFERTIAAYEELFGRENVGVFLYEDLVKRPAEFSASVCRFLGVPAEAAWCANGVPRENSGIYTNRWLVYRPIARALGPFNPMERALSGRQLRDFLAAGKRQPLEVSESWRQALAARYARGNRDLAARHALDLAASRYPT